MSGHNIVDEWLRYAYADFLSRNEKSAERRFCPWIIQTQHRQPPADGG